MQRLCIKYSINLHIFTTEVKTYMFFNLLPLYCSSRYIIHKYMLHKKYIWYIFGEASIMHVRNIHWTELRGAALFTGNTVFSHLYSTPYQLKRR